MKKNLIASAAIALITTPALSSTVQVGDIHPKSSFDDGDLVSMIDSANFSLGEAVIKEPRYNKISDTLPNIWGEEFVLPVIQGNEPRYQRLYTNMIDGQFTPRPIYQRSEDGGKTQECMIVGIPDDVIHVSKEDIKESSPSEIIQAIYFGDLAEQALETREENPEYGVGSNAQYFRTDNDLLVIQAGHNAYSGFVGTIDNDGNIKITDGVRGTAENNASGYMTVVSGVMNDVTSGKPIVAVQHGVNTTTISIYDTAPDATQAQKNCNKELQDPAVQEELKSKERTALTFNGVALKDTVDGYGRIEMIVKEQARKETYKDLKKGVEDFKIVALNEVTGALAGYPYGADYLKEIGGNRFASYGCYLKQEYGPNGELVSMAASHSFLDPSKTSCMGGEFAKVTYPPIVQTLGKSTIGTPKKQDGNKRKKDGNNHRKDLPKITIVNKNHRKDPETPSTVPLPSTLASMVGGLFGLAALRRRRRQP